MKFIWHTSTNSQQLSPITQIYGVCFDEKGNILIVKEKGKEWNIPGGKPELDETPIQTLKRELKEEVNVEIDQNKMIGYFEVLSINSTIYQLRFAATVKMINELSLNERKFVKPNEFFDYVKIEDYWPMIDEAIKWFASIPAH